MSFSARIFYTEDRGVKVLDFGLAKVFPEGIETTMGRRVGMGSPAYAAPEQLEGHALPDVRFDVHGLGMTLWEMLAGRHPDADVLGDVQALLKRRMTTMPPSLTEVAGLPPRVDEVVRRALMKDPAKRYGSMMEMARTLMDLSAWVAAESRAGRLTTRVPPGEPPLPGDANTWRDYRPAEPTPSHESPPSGPQERVLVAPAARAPAPLIATERLAPVARPAGLAATVPLDQAPAPVHALPPAAPPRHATPTAVAHTQHGVPTPKPRTSWLAVVSAGAAVSVGAVVLVVWMLGRRPVPAVSETAPAPSATVIATATPETPLVPEAPVPPPVASTAARPPASTVPPALPRKPIGRSAGPSVLYTPLPPPPPPPPAPQSGPLFRGE